MSTLISNFLENLSLFDRTLQGNELRVFYQGFHILQDTPNLQAVEHPVVKGQEHMHHTVHKQL